MNESWVHRRAWWCGRAQFLERRGGQQQHSLGSHIHIHGCVQHTFELFMDARKCVLIFGCRCSNVAPIVLLRVPTLFGTLAPLMVPCIPTLLNSMALQHFGASWSSLSSRCHHRHPVSHCRCLPSCPSPSPCRWWPIFNPSVHFQLLRCCLVYIYKCPAWGG